MVPLVHPRKVHLKLEVHAQDATWRGGGPRASFPWEQRNWNGRRRGGEAPWLGRAPARLETEVPK